MVVFSAQKAMVQTEVTNIVRNENNYIILSYSLQFQSYNHLFFLKILVTLKHVYFQYKK